MLLSDDELAFINAIYLKKETGKGAAATASGERRRHGSSSKGSIQMVVILRVRPALWPCQLPTWGVGCQPDQPLDRPVSAFPEAWGREVLGRGAVPAIRITHGRIPGGIWSLLRPHLEKIFACGAAALDALVAIPTLWI